MYILRYVFTDYILCYVFTVYILSQINGITINIASGFYMFDNV